MATSRSSTNTFLFLAFILSSSVMVHAQYTRTAERGFQPSGSYAVGDIETINTSNGNVMLNMPLAGLPAGRGGLSARVNLVYDSKLYNTNTTYSNCPAVPAGAGLLPKTPPYPGCGGDPGFPSELLAFSTEGGWRYNFKYALRAVYSAYDGHVSCNPQQPTTVDIIKMQVVYPDGSTHDFRLSGYSEPDQGQANYFPIDHGGNATPNSYCQGYSSTTNNLLYYSVDGTYTRLEVEHGTLAWTLYLPDGSRVTSATASQGQRIYDRNNNYLEIVTSGFTYNGNPASKIFDQLGRQVIIENIAATNTDLIHAWGVGNQELIWTVKWKTIAINKSYQSGWGGIVSIPSFQKNRRVVDQIILPAIAGQTAQAYTFGYNAGTANPSLGWGEVSSITTPTGAQVSYIWAMDGVTGGTARAYDVLKNSLVRKDLSYLAEFDGSSSVVTDQWFYSVNQDSGVTQITGPNSAVTTEHFLPGETKGYKTERPDGSIVECIWANNNPYGYPHGDANNIVKTELSSIRDGAGNLSKTAIVDYKYDKNGNVTKVTEYDWVGWNAVPRDGSGKPTGIPGNAVINRISVSGYHNQTVDSADTTTNDPNSYTYLTAPRLLRAPASSEIKWGNATDGSQTLSRNEFTYDNAATTGNLTQHKSWDSTKGAYSNPLGSNSISISTQYNSYGSPTLTTDARGYQTQFYYGTVGGFADLYPTQVKTAYSTSVQRIETRQYDFYTGVVTRVTDVDNNVSTVTSYDVFGRPILVRAAEDKPEETRTSTEYSDVYRRVIQRSDLNTVGDGKLVSIQHYDQLGRVRLNRQLEDSASQTAEDETAGIKVQTRYINSGTNSYQLVSNPYRAAYSSSAGSEATMGWTRTKSDKGGRVLEVQTFSGSGLPSPWGSNSLHSGIVSTSYNAQFTTVTDQAGKVRRSKVDGLGRLIRVDEPDSSGSLGTTTTPTQPTSYVYDVAGSLKTVTQGAQERTFVYDSLKRLTSTINPETGTVSYTYDDNANLLTKTDARQLVTTYTYDPLNRNTSIRYTNYSFNAHRVDRYYDGETVPNGQGRLWKTVSTEVGPWGRAVVVLGTSTVIVNEYDGLGRAISGAQVTDDQTYSMSYSFNRAGGQTSMTYPSGRTVTTEYDPAGRMAGVQHQQSGTYYAGGAATDATNRMQYAAHGGLAVMKLGNGLWEHTNFNNRLQPTEIGLGSTSTSSGTLGLTYNYGTTNNNGNVWSVSYAGGGLSYTQTFGYDALNRLTTSSESGGSWSQTNIYDRYGNRAIELGGGNQSLTFNTANNRITNAGYVYDAAGNLTSDGVHSYGFDGENKIKSVDGMNDVYRYDGDGNRIRKNFASGEKVRMVYSGGQLIAEYDLSSGVLLKEYVYGGKGLIATVEPSAGTKYATTDHLGSPRVVTSSIGAVISRHDYKPFGEEIGAGIGGRTTAMGFSVANGGRQKFTSKERDSESGLDYFLARYYSATQGRFTSIDPADSSMQVQNPQSFNRYSYTLNNPLRYVDPDGLIPVETAMDVVSLAYSFYELTSNPSWVNAGFFVWDVAALTPYVPGSYVAKGIRLSRESVEWSSKVGSQGYRGLKAAGVVDNLDDFETVTNNQFIRSGVALLGQGDNSVRQVLGMSKGEKAADFLGVTASGTFKIAEAKGSNLATAVQQLDNTARALVGKVGDVKYTAEVILRRRQRLPGNFKIVGNQLHRWDDGIYDSATGKWGAWTLQKANGKAITVRYQ